MPAWLAAERPDANQEQAAASPPDQIAALPEGPLYGPPVPIGPIEAADTAGAPASNEAGSGQAVATANEMADRADEIVARAGEIATRAEELAARAEEFANRIDGLNTRIDELEARLEASESSASARLALVPSPVPLPRASETVAARAGQSQSGPRAPWVILPQPGPGSRVTAGPLVLETRARGEAPIARLNLVLDGVALPVAVERRNDKDWQGRASTRVSPGSHTVAVSVVDAQGRTGSYRWQFAAAQ